MFKNGNRPNSIFSKLSNRIRFMSRERRVISSEDKLRVLFVLGRYPEYSETYMHEEMVAVSETCEIKIVSYLVVNNPRKNPLPYTLVEYNDACINWGDFNRVNVDLTNEAQGEFLYEMATVIEAFRPDVLHGHYFATSLITRRLAEIHGIPFTIRTHSFDMLKQKPKKMAALYDAVKSPWCIGIFTFPAFTNLFLKNGVAKHKVNSAWPVVKIKRFHNPEKSSITGRVMCCGPCIEKKAHKDFVDLAVKMKQSGLGFDLYTKGEETDLLQLYNESKGSPITIAFCEPERMDAVYKNHDWLVYTSDTKIIRVGLPVSIAEAQASGLGVCWQEMPGRRQEQLDYMGGAGFLFKTIDEVPEIICQPYPDEMRKRGLENSKKCDVDIHKQMLVETWRKY